MSNWTHVAAIFRIDSFHDRNEMDKLNEIIGEECLFDAPDWMWDEVEANPIRYLPMGSEGSLEKSIWENPDKNCMSAYTISVFGDLRDHDEPQGIIDWFDTKCSQLLEYFMIRQAVITVENELNGTLTKAYVNEENAIEG